MSLSLPQERISGFKLEIPKPHDEQAYEVQKQFTLTSSIDKGSNATFNWQLQLDTLNLSYNSTSKTHAFIPPSVGEYFTVCVQHGIYKPVVTHYEAIIMTSNNTQ